MEKYIDLKRVVSTKVEVLTNHENSEALSGEVYIAGVKSGYVDLWKTEKLSDGTFSTGGSGTWIDDGAPQEVIDTVHQLMQEEYGARHYTFPVQLTRKEISHLLMLIRLWYEQERSHASKAEVEMSDSLEGKLLWR